MKLVALEWPLSSLMCGQPMIRQFLVEYLLAAMSVQCFAFYYSYWCDGFQLPPSFCSTSNVHRYVHSNHYIYTYWLKWMHQTNGAQIERTKKRQILIVIAAQSSLKHHTTRINHNFCTYIFGRSLITLSWRLSVQAIGSFTFLRHGKQKQQFRTSSSGSVVLWILFVLRQHKNFARHMLHLLRCLLLLSIIVVASLAAAVAIAVVAVVVAWVASVAACGSIDVTSSMFFFCLFRLHHLNRFQQESAFVSVSFKIVATAAACFSPASNFCVPPRLLQQDNFFKRRHGKQSADA